VSEQYNIRLDTTGYISYIYLDNRNINKYTTIRSRAKVIGIAGIAGRSETRGLSICLIAWKLC